MSLWRCRKNVSSKICILDLLESFVKKLGPCFVGIPWFLRYRRARKERRLARQPRRGCGLTSNSQKLFSLNTSVSLDSFNHWSNSDSRYAISTMAKLVVFEDSRCSPSHVFLPVSFHSLYLSKFEEQIQLREFLFSLISKGHFLLVLSSVILPLDITLSLGCLCSRFFLEDLLALYWLLESLEN